MTHFRRLRKVLFCISTIGLLYGKAYAADPNLDADLLRVSLTMGAQLINDMREGTYPPAPSYSIKDEGDRPPLGCVYSKVKGVSIIALRGSEGAEELLDNHDRSKTPINSIFKEMKGQCQEPYWNRFILFRNQIKNVVDAIYSTDPGLTLVIGYSRGGALAPFFAAYLGQYLSENKKAPLKNTIVVTCGAPSILDEAGSASFTQLAEKYFKGFLNLRAREDLIATYLDNKGFQPFKAISYFSAYEENVENYRTRIFSGKYTNMDPKMRSMLSFLDNPAPLDSVGGLLGLAVRGALQSGLVRPRGMAIDPIVFGIRSWEAHTFLTYESYLLRTYKQHLSSVVSASPLSLSPSFSALSLASPSSSASPSVASSGVKRGLGGEPFAQSGSSEEDEDCRAS